MTNDASPSVSNLPAAKPTPVTSAQQAINEMRAKSAPAAPIKLVTSAREAMNAAAEQNSTRTSKSAANLHHGSLNTSLESTRTSASALLTRAKSPVLNPSKARPRDSFDPLAPQRPVITKTRPAASEPRVVRTSLKLGSAARPKEQPVVLPPGARMAQRARDVSAPEGAVDVQVLPVGAAVPSGAKVLPARRNPARDPQMVGGKRPRQLAAQVGAVPVSHGQPNVNAKPQYPPKVSGNNHPINRPRTAQGMRAKAKNMIDVQLGAANPGRRFRTAPQGYATRVPSMPVAEGYVLSEPTSLTQSHPPVANQPQPSVAANQGGQNLVNHNVKPNDGDLGVVENYHPNRPGDSTPIGVLAAREVASGHGSAAAVDYGAPARGRSAAEQNIKADNNPSYSFLRKPETEAKDAKPAKKDASRQKLGAQSPFLKSVQVDKRPLSENAKPRPATVSLPESAPIAKGSSRKNIYQKKVAKEDLPARPTVIVPSSRRSKMPLFFLILLTIILGAVVGAAAYLCFFQ